MKQTKKAAYFLSGMLVALLLFHLASPALAVGLEKLIEVSTGISIYVDDVKLDARDSAGNPVEPFVYNGTTYLPVRAVSEALGKNVQWDGSTRSVFIGKHGESGSSLLDVCPPYETNQYKSPATITMAGNKYSNGFTLSRGFDKNLGFAYFNLNGKYNTLNFEVGHVDGKDMFNGTCDIYLDGKLAVSLNLTSDMLPTSYSILLNGALQMKIVMDCETIGNAYGFVNLIVE